MKTIIEIILGAFLGFIFLKPVFGAYEFPPYIEPNEVKIFMDEEPSYFVRAALEKNSRAPSWIVRKQETHCYYVYIKTRKASYRTTKWIQREWDRFSKFNYNIHKPEKVYFRLGTENYIAEGFTEYPFFSRFNPFYYLRTMNRIFVAFPTGKVWTAKVQDYSAYVNQKMRMESASSNPPKGKYCFGCTGVPPTHQ